MNAPAAARQLLRSRIRPMSAAAVRVRMTQETRQISNKNDLGGPGGQERIPPKPAGSEVMKRNIPLYAGLGLVAIAVYAYMTQPKESQKMAGKAIHNAQNAKEAGKDELNNTKLEVAGAVQKLGGRGSEGQKGFRSE